MILKTITLPKKELRKMSEEIIFPLSDIDKKIAENMIFYLKLAAKKNNDLRPGIGIAAIQLGFLKRMFLVDFVDEYGEKNYELLINPKLIAESETYAAINTGEGCLSIKETDPGQDGLVHRKNKIVIEGYSYFQGKNVTITKAGFGAIVYQHELDHLNGILFIDRINKQNVWKKKNKEEVLI